MDTADRRLLTDPMLRGGMGPVRRRAPPIKADLTGIQGILVSHLHHDHLDVPTLRLLPAQADIVVPRGAARIIPRHFVRVHEVLPGESVAFGSVAVRAVPARHPGSRFPLGPSGPALGYVVEGDHRVYFAGDTSLFPGMGKLAADLDVALLPVGGWGPTLRSGHMDPVQAAEALRLLRPRIAIPIHWGTLWPFGLGRVRRDRFEQPAQRFLAEARRRAPGVAVEILPPGGTMVL